MTIYRCIVLKKKRYGYVTIVSTLIENVSILSHWYFAEAKTTALLACKAFTKYPYKQT
jgi:hypothetical protein